MAGKNWNILNDFVLENNAHRKKAWLRGEDESRDKYGFRLIGIAHFNSTRIV